MKRPRRIQAGDHVSILRPVFVKRVGYPKVLADYMREAWEILNPALRKLAGNRIAELDVGEAQLLRCPEYKVAREVAYILAKRDGFGGPQRTIHTFEVPAHEGVVAIVTGKHRVVTGTYSKGRTGYEYEDNDGPSLEGATHHTILHLTFPGSHRFDTGPLIEECNVRWADAVRAGKVEATLLQHPEEAA